MQIHPRLQWTLLTFRLCETYLVIIIIIIITSLAALNLFFLFHLLISDLNLLLYYGLHFRGVSSHMGFSGVKTNTKLIHPRLQWTIDFLFYVT